jgi:hypothetical protein
MAARREPGVDTATIAATSTTKGVAMARGRLATLAVAGAVLCASAAAFAASGDESALLVKGGEAPGYKAGKRARSTDVQAFVVSTGAPASQRGALLRHYVSEGFVAASSEPLTGAGGAGGVSTVLRFRTAAGAKKEQAYALTRIGPQRFAVPGVPGAKGAWVRDDQGAAADVVWTEGACVALIGDYVPGVTIPATTPLVTAAKAIVKRTHGACG